MICSKCNQEKNDSEFYFIDGGLGYTKQKITICKLCTQQYNQSRVRFKYFDEQITAQFYGAKSVINGEKLTSIAKNIENGIAEGSNRMGIQNFLYLFGHESGLPSSSKQMQKIYNNLTKKQTIIYPDEIEDNNLFEGTKKQIIVNAYERSSQECINEYGYKCAICEFDFEEKYGEIGKNFIHVHHIKPLSEIDEKYKINPIEDLRPVCPNCHAMLHKRKPAYSIKEIKNLIDKNDL
jgi:hypothetical protein